MSDTKYAYAVARIRALENGLFSSAQIEQLLSVKSYEGALRFLTEHGWGDADTPLSAEAILTREKTKTWETVRDLLKGDDAILAVLSYGDLYHNLKAAIKDAAAPGSHGNVYFDDCEVDGVRMAKIVAEKDWQALPAHMREAAKEASQRETENYQEKPRSSPSARRPPRSRQNRHCRGCPAPPHP